MTRKEGFKIVFVTKLFEEISKEYVNEYVVFTPAGYAGFKHMRGFGYGVFEMEDELTKAIADCENYQVYKNGEFLYSMGNIFAEMDGVRS